MNVRELITILSKYPPDAEVIVSDLSDDHREPVTVYDRTGDSRLNCDHLAVFIDARPEPRRAGRGGAE